MDKRKSILNITVSVGFKIVTIVLALVTQRLLIKFCGNEVNGLNALYIGIIDFLGVVELGIGAAVTFCMYKPIVEGDREQVSALYFLFQRLYWMVGLIILLVGLALTPFIQYLAKDYAQVDVNMQGTFVLILISSVITYLFGAKAALFNAHKNNYVATAISSGGFALQRIMQIVSVIVTHSFTWYLVSRIVAAAVQWTITEITARKKYHSIISNKKKLSEYSKGQVHKTVRAMAMHKIGQIFANTGESVVISAFIGVVALGYYTNYTTILKAMSSTLLLIFTSLTSVIGHLFVKENRQTAQKYCEAFQLLNFLLGMVFYLGYYAVIDNLVVIFFGDGLSIAKEISFVMAFNGFVNFVRQSMLLFRDATGTFYHDRWKSILEGAANVILSVILIRWLGVAGVILAKIVANLLICHVVEPYVIYKYAFCASPKRHYIRNYGMIGIFAVALLALHFGMVTVDDQWLELLINGCISVGISGVVCIGLMLKYKDLLSLLVGMKGKKKNLSG